MPGSRSCRGVTAQAGCRFLVMGGECNLLLRCTPEYGLEFVPNERWKSSYMLSWSQHDVDATLDAAQQILLETAAHLSLPVTVGWHPAAPLALAGCSHSADALCR